jgi:hypothetical protein
MINTNVTRNYQTAEYGKFIEFDGDARYPAVSVTRLSYPDTTSAFPGNSAAKPLSSVDIYPKYGVLSYIANPEDISFTVYLSAENVSVELGEIEKDIHNVVALCNTMTAQNLELNGYVDDLEKNTFDTASAIDDVYYELVKTNTLLNTVTANQGTQITLEKTLSASNATTANQVITNNLLNALTASNATATNQVTTNTLLNTVTANQGTQITLEKTLSANSVYGTLLAQPLFTTITNPISGNIGVSTALNWGITIVAVTSSAYVQFPSNVAHVASLMNTTGGVLYVGKWNNSSTVGLPLLNNSSIEINLTGNTNEIGVKSTLTGTVSAYAMYTDWNNN